MVAKAKKETKKVGKKAVKKHKVSKVSSEKKKKKISAAPKATKRTPKKKTIVKKPRTSKKEILTKEAKTKILQEEKIVSSKVTAKGVVERQETSKQSLDSIAQEEIKVSKREVKIAKEKIQEKPREEIIEEVRPKPSKYIELDLPVTLKDLSVKLQEKPSILIKYLIEKQKKFVTINQLLDGEIVEKTLADFGFGLSKKKSDEECIEERHVISSDDKLLARPPVVTLMGHVDHGKTSLLDAIQKSRIADREHGGITQHIGAYSVKTAKGQVTFLDTPGHEAFTAMRARGANITDIVILVVAADDGVMPQTIEAIDHAKAAGVPIVVAINKIDKPQVDLDKVKRQLSDHGLTPEEWSGQTITVSVSAKTREGIDTLLEMIILESEMLELKAPYDKLASGVVAEAKLSKGRGPVSTVLVQNGTLKIGDNVVCGDCYGKIRAMFNDLGERINKVTPGVPAEILGLSGVPVAGEKFYAIQDEKRIKDIVAKRRIHSRLSELAAKPKHISLDDLYNQIQEGQIKELSLIIKADVQGSLEAIKGSLGKLEHKEVKLKILHSGIGPINASDVILAEASNAVVIGFHVDAEAKAKEEAEKDNVEIRTYRVIYELINEIRAALEGLLEPRIKKVFMGRVEIRRVFDLSKSGKVAGCFVVKGKIIRSASVQLTRAGNTVFEGKLSALKRFKDDVREVLEGYECGISFEGFTDFQAGDIIEAHSIEKISRKL